MAQHCVCVPSTHILNSPKLFHFGSVPEIRLSLKILQMGEFPSKMATKYLLPSLERKNTHMSFKEGRFQSGREPVRELLYKALQRNESGIGEELGRGLLTALRALEGKGPAESPPNCCCSDRVYRQIHHPNKRHQTKHQHKDRRRCYSTHCFVSS